MRVSQLEPANRRDVDRFIQFPFHLYRDSPHYAGLLKDAGFEMQVEFGSANRDRQIGLPERFLQLAEKIKKRRGLGGNALLYAELYHTLIDNGQFLYGDLVQVQETNAGWCASWRRRESGRTRSTRSALVLWCDQSVKDLGKLPLLEEHALEAGEIAAQDIGSRAPCSPYRLLLSTSSHRAAAEAWGIAPSKPSYTGNHIEEPHA